MKDIKAEAAATQIRLRAMAVAAGLMTEAEAKQWIIVRAGELGKGVFKNAEVPPVCTGCGHDHSKDDEWVPLEIGISREVPDHVRDKFILLMQQGSGAVN